MISDKEQDDLEFVRKTYKDMLENSTSAVSLMMDLLRDTESPRCGEVTANLIKSTADIADKLVDLHKSNKELRAPSKNHQEALPPGSSVTNNNVFVGTTADLQKLLSGKLEQEKIIEQ